MKPGSPDAAGSGVPPQSPIAPQALSLDSTIRFDCHPGIACFNACCHNSDVQLTPLDIIRLKRRFGLSAARFVARYTVPFEMDHHGMPGLRLARKPASSACVFLGEEGCGVYEDRPLACRYYALGKMHVREKGAAQTGERYFLVREDYCEGHGEPVTLTIRDYLARQGIPEYEAANRQWMDIIVRKRSAGAAIGAPSARSLQLFDMCSYDIDGFRAFVQQSGFRDIFDLPEGEMETILASDENLLAFSMRFLRQVLFGEQSIDMKKDAKEKRMTARRPAWRQRREREIAARRQASEARGEEK